MLFSGTVFEVAGRGISVSVVNSLLVLETSEYSWLYKPTLQSLTWSPSLQGGYVIEGLGGLWVLGTDTPLDIDSETAVFLDYYNSGLSYPPEDSYFLDAIICDSKFFYKVNVTRKRTEFCVKDFDTGAVKHRIIENEGMPKFSGNSERVFGIFREKIMCFDFDLNCLWSIPVKIWNVAQVKESAQLFNDLIIINLGCESRDDERFVVAAFSQADGSQVWRYVLPHPPMSSELIGDRVYIALDWQMIVLDAATGEPLVNCVSGFDYFPKDHEMAYHYGKSPLVTRSTYLHTDGEHLFFISSPHRVIRVFSFDGRTRLQDIEMPTPITPYTRNPITPLAQTPYSVDGKTFFPLSFNVDLAGVLVLEPRADDSGSMTIAPRTTIDIERIEDDSACFGFRIAIDTEDFGDILRFGSVQIRELALFYGQDRSQLNDIDDKHYDLMFNGRFVLVVPKSLLPDDGDIHVTALCKRILDDLSSVMCQAWNNGKRQALEITVEYV